MSRASAWAKSLFQPKLKTDIPIKVVLTSGHTANAIEVFASDGTTSLFSVSPAGAVTPAGGTDLADTFTVHDPVTVGKKARLDAGAVTDGQTRVMAVPDYNGTLATLAGTESLTNKTLTAPKIGTSILDTAGLELLKLTATATAVNELTLANAAAGGSPVLSATGDDTDVSIVLTPKGAGKIVCKKDVIRFGVAVANTTASDQTFTAAQMLTGLISRDPNGGNRADLLDTAANIVAAIPGAEIGRASCRERVSIDV